MAGQRATFGRVETTPNSHQLGAVGGHRLDGRAVRDATRPWPTSSRRSRGRPRSGPSATGRRSRSPPSRCRARSTSTPDLAARIAADHEGGDWPVIPTQAGHDAGILSAQGIPSAMLFVRNPTGVSHSPAEHAEIADCLAGVDALAETLERLAR